MIQTEICNHQTIARFLCNELDLDEMLDFLDHIQECKQCWTEVYNARKNEHPHYYKKTTRRLKVTEKELAQFNRPASSEENENEEVYQLARELEPKEIDLPQLSVPGSSGNR